MIATLPWPDIDTVLLDMDGTLLIFTSTITSGSSCCRSAMPNCTASAAPWPNWSSRRCSTNTSASSRYCSDYWTRELNLPIREMKREIAELIALRPSADEFLGAAPLTSAWC